MIFYVDKGSISQNSFFDKKAIKHDIAKKYCQLELFY